jgi:PAS domain S-box-containing protein
MPEMTTISKAELDNLKERAKILAADKAYLQLTIQMMNRLSAVSGLENVVDGLLKAISDAIGGVNTILYYLIDHDTFYADVYGNKQQLESIDDVSVNKVMTTHEPIEQEQPFSNTKMLTPEFTKAFTWIVPLLVGNELVGVLKMEYLHISMRELSKQLPTFFSFAALVLKNEILGYTRLKEAYDGLAREVVVRKQTEEELRRFNETLEERVAARTAELQDANKQLRENELQIRSLLDKSEKSRLALLSILEDERMIESALKEQYSTLHGIIESTDALIFSIDRKYNYTSFNEKHAAAMKAFYGVEIEIGHSFLDYITVAEDRDTAKSNFDRTLAGEHLTEEAYSGKEPELHRYFRISHSPIRDDHGNVIGIVVLAQDLTDRKLAESALQESERRFEELLKEINLAAIILDINGNITFINDFLLELTGGSRTSVLGSNLLDFSIPQDRKKELKRVFVDSIAEDKVPQEYEFEIITTEDELHTIVLNNVTIHDMAGKVVGVASIGNDVTEQRRAAEEIRDSRKQVLDILESVTDGFFALDNDWRFTYINHRAEELFGIERVNLLFRPIWQILAKEEVPVIFEQFHLSKRQMTPISFEEFIPRFGKWLEIHTYSYENGLSVYFHDITDRKQMEKALRESEELNRLTLSNITDALFLVDDAGSFIYICPNVDVIFGYSLNEVQAIGNINYLLGKELFKHTELEASQKLTNIELEIKDKFGKIHVLLINILHVNIKGGTRLYICRDITERKKAEQERETMRIKIEAERSFLEAVIQQMPIGVIIAEAPLGNVIAGNKSFERIWRLPFREANLIEAHERFKLFHRQNNRLYKLEERPLYRAINKGEVVKNEIMKFMRGDGSFGVISESAAPIYNQKGRIIAAVTVFEEVS